VQSNPHLGCHHKYHNLDTPSREHEPYIIIFRFSLPLAYLEQKSGVPLTDLCLLRFHESKSVLLNFPLGMAWINREYILRLLMFAFLVLLCLLCVNAVSSFRFGPIIVWRIWHILQPWGLLAKSQTTLRQTFQFLHLHLFICFVAECLLFQEVRVFQVCPIHSVAKASRSP